MPNWCDTTYKCVGNKKEITILHNHLKHIQKRKTTIVKNGFGKWWLGNLVTLLNGDWEKYCCRGEITDFHRDSDTELTISQNTAWCEQEGVRKIIQERLPSIKVYFIDEETGCGRYVTNDITGKYFDDNYLIDGTDIWEYFSTIEGLTEYVSKIVGKKVDSDLTSCMNALDEYVAAQEDDDLYFNIYVLERVD